MNGHKGNPNNLEGKLLMGQLDKSMVGRDRGLRGKLLMDQLEINVDLLLVNSWPEHGMFIEYRISTKSLSIILTNSSDSFTNLKFRIYHFFKTNIYYAFFFNCQKEKN